MNLNELRAAGGFIESALVRKEITWTRVPAGRKKAVSDTFQVFVRRNSFGAVERLFSAEGDQQSRNARYLAECIRLGETGEESLTYEQAYDLDPALGFLLLQAVGEANRGRRFHRRCLPAFQPARQVRRAVLLAARLHFRLPLGNHRPQQPHG